jgi:hypothetical protein
MTSVIVIGAGAAGLSAGFELFMNATSFKVLEASDRIGGRIKKLEVEGFADFPISLGAEWLHFDQLGGRDLLGDMAYNPGIDIETYAWDPHWSSYKNGGSAFKNGGRWTTPKQFDDKEWKFFNYSWFEYFDEHIASHFVNDIEHNCVVNQVNHETIPMQVSCRDGRTYSADYVIVTACPAVILENIQFTPALPRKYRKAINSLVYPNALRVSITCSLRQAVR